MTTTTAAPTAAPVNPAAAKIGQSVFFYAEHAHGMKCLDKLEPFAATVAFPANSFLGDDGVGFAARVGTLVAPPAAEPTTPVAAPASIMGAPASTAPASPAPPPATGPIATVGRIEGGRRYRNGSYTNIPLVGGTGTGAEATIAVEGGAVTSVVVTKPGDGYTVGDVLVAGANDRLVNLMVVDHAGVSFPMTAVPFFLGDDKDDKAAPFHCEATYRRLEKPAPFAVVVPAAQAA